MPIINCANEQCRKEMYVSPEHVETMQYCPKCQKEKDIEWEKYWKNPDGTEQES